MKRKIAKKDLERLVKKGSFTTYDLMAFGLTEEQATVIIKKLAADGVIKIMPFGIAEN